MRQGVHTVASRTARASAISRASVVRADQGQNEHGRPIPAPVEREGYRLAKRVNHARPKRRAGGAPRAWVGVRVGGGGHRHGTSVSGPSGRTPARLRTADSPLNREGGRLPGVPVILVAGNHEAFRWIETVLQGSPSDRRRSRGTRAHCRRSTGLAAFAFCRRAGGFGHLGGAAALSPASAASNPAYGHCRQHREPMAIGATPVHPLGDATSDRSGVNWHVVRDARATVIGSSGQVSATTRAPQRLNELRREAWAPTPDPHLVAPQLAAWIRAGR